MQLMGVLGLYLVATAVLEGSLSLSRPIRAAMATGTVTISALQPFFSIVQRGSLSA